MDSQKSVIWMCSLLLISSPVVGGGPISWASCMAVVGVGGLVLGAAILPLLGFTSTGIAAGSWAAWMMSLYGGSVPAGSLFAILQSTGAAGVSWGSFGGISGFCAALTAPFP
ncbi:interferon alpha-inducible protein 27-like protein 1 [Mytilus edulis]|uniref:interferon alpha-inducible protein 27-like protein 1 n=1 Tax=Mytilus edulis TaxID=6550 RepID=UPI0039F0D429